MRDTVFVFLVGDYLLAEGSLRSVLARINAGASGVLAPTLPLPLDAAERLIRDQGGAKALALAPHLLVQRALAHLPKTAADVNGDAPFLHDANANRLFWRAGEHTLIGRFHLLHMIAIRPEVTDFVIGAPCDY